MRAIVSKFFRKFDDFKWSAFRREILEKVSKNFFTIYSNLYPECSMNEIFPKIFFKFLKIFFNFSYICSNSTITCKNFYKNWLKTLPKRFLKIFSNINQKFFEAYFMLYCSKNFFTIFRKFSWECSHNLLKTFSKLSQDLCTIFFKINVNVLSGFRTRCVQWNLVVMRRLFTLLPTCGLHY